MPEDEIRPDTDQEFARVAREEGLVSDGNVEECLMILEAARKSGIEPRPIDEIMVEREFLTSEEVKAVKVAVERYRRDKDRDRTVPFRLGGYEILGKIGDGGLGIVYKARQISMHRIVALKVLHRKWLKDEEFKKRFRLEARLAGRLSHQHLIQVFDIGQEKGTYYFSMEYIDGPTVEEIIERDGPLPLEKALDIAIQVLRAVRYLQSFDIVHRDIKPGNIMLTKGGLAKLGDFGFVKSKWDPLLSHDGEVLGTPDYISPEQAMGAEEIDFRSDIYSLGATLYHMITGQPPFEGTGSTVMRKHIRAQLPDMRESIPNLPGSVCHIIEKMMAKEPKDRYQTCQELFDDLELVKLGHDPLSKRLEEGKSIIVRTLRMEQTKLDRTRSDLDRAAKELQRLRKAYCIAVITASAAVAVMALLLVLLLLASSGTKV